MPDDLAVAVSKVSEDGLVSIPFEIRKSLGLRRGTRMSFTATEEALVLN